VHERRDDDVLAQQLDERVRHDVHDVSDGRSTLD
jgi:hypothetical protein